MKTKKDLNEMKEILKLMRENKVAAFEIGDLKVSFHPEAFVSTIFSENISTSVSNEEKEELAKKEEEKQLIEENDLLFHSSN